MSRNSTIKNRNTVATDSQSMSLLTRPWFVLTIVFVCFAILTPKIFLPLFRQIFGLNSEPNESVNDRFAPPPMRKPSVAVPGENTGRQFPGRPGPSFGATQAGGGSSSRSVLTFLLPVYAVGIGVYMVYTLFKVFNRNEKKSAADDYEDMIEGELKSRTTLFRENNCESAFAWDATSGQFRLKRNDHFAKSQESEDELDNYEQYRNLDPDYVDHVKKLRRKKKEQSIGGKTATAAVNGKAIPLTPNVGLTSITNTNVLMNDTLERMKFSLNKINVQLTEAEKKGGSLEDQDLDDLRIQLSQTEQQMARIMKIVNNATESDAIKSVLTPNPEFNYFERTDYDNYQNDNNLDELDEEIDETHEVKTIDVDRLKCRKNPNVRKIRDLSSTSSRSSVSFDSSVSSQISNSSLIMNKSNNPTAKCKSSSKKQPPKQQQQKSTSKVDYENNGKNKQPTNGNENTNANGKTSNKKKKNRNKNKNKKPLKEE